jgi:hypothetical protein
LLVDALLQLLEDKITVFQELLPDEDVLALVGQSLAPDVKGISEVADPLDVVGHQDIAASFYGLVDQLEQDVVLVVHPVEIKR